MRPSSEKPRGRSALQEDRDARHSDLLVQIQYDRVGAEMRGLAECIATYRETLIEQGVPEWEVFELVRDFAGLYWEQQLGLSSGIE